MVEIARSNFPGGLWPADPASEMVRLAATGGDVRELQRRLWVAAKRSPGRRFHALYDRIYRSDVLREAWARVQKNKGAAGVDKQTVAAVQEYGVERLLGELQRDLRSGSYRPRPVRRVEIPKPAGGKRPLGIPTVRDRVCQQAARIVLEPIFEADFLAVSYGFRPRRKATDAKEVLRRSFIDGHRFVFEADIRNCLVPSSHCHGVHGRGVEELVSGGNPDSQALSAALADVDGVQLAALDTLQHGLAGDAEGAHSADDRDVAAGSLVDEQRAELVVDADAPGSAGGVLLAGDEAVVEPPVQGGGATPRTSAALAIGSSSPSGG